MKFSLISPLIVGKYLLKKYFSEKGKNIFIIKL